MIQLEQDGGSLVEKVTLDGRTFRPAFQTTFEQDFYLMDRVATAGLDKMVDGLKPDADLEEFSRDLLLKAYRSGKLFEILAGVMIEEDSPLGWMVEEAEANAEFFRNLSDPDDKVALQGVLVGVILGFFVNADGSLTTSPKPSGRRSTPAPERESLLPVGVAESARREELSSSENGET